MEELRRFLKQTPKLNEGEKTWFANSIEKNLSQMAQMG
jgi:hypothetical protein